MSKPIAVPRITNKDLLKAAFAKYPNFTSITAEQTAKLLTEKGFEAIESINPQAISETLNLLLRVVLDEIHVNQVRDPLADSGIGVPINMEFGEYAQSMTVHAILPVSPAFMKLKDGDTVDMQKVRLPKITERFFGRNFAFQVAITIPGRWNFQRAFTSDYGISELIAGIMTQLENAWIKQVYVNKLECIGAAIAGSSDYPLQATQKVNISIPVIGDAPTEADIFKVRKVLLTVKDVITKMCDVGAATNAFNEMGNEDITRKEDLKILARPGFKNLVDFANAFVYHGEKGSLGLDVVEVENFGGLEPYGDSGYSSRVYPVYDTWGTIIGYNTAPAQTVTNVDQVYWKDPHEDVELVIMHKDKIKFNLSHPMTVKAAPYNVRGEYQNFFGNAENNALNVDRQLPMVVFTKVV